MNKVCPNCNSSHVADIVYGLIRPGGLPKGCVAGGCAVDFDIKWRCQSCGFDWGPIDYLRNSVQNLEEDFIEYFKNSQGGFESSLSYFSTGQWLSIPFVLAGFYFVWKANKDYKIAAVK